MIDGGVGAAIGALQLALRNGFDIRSFNLDSEVGRAKFPSPRRCRLRDPGLMRYPLPDGRGSERYCRRRAREQADLIYSIPITILAGLNSWAAAPPTS